MSVRANAALASPVLVDAKCGGRGPARREAAQSGPERRGPDRSDPAQSGPAQSDPAQSGPKPKRIEVVAGILWREGRFLAACRPEGSAHAGLWEFPGGKMEPGERAEESLARELREELGIEAGPLQFWRTVEHVYLAPSRHVVLHFFHVRNFEGAPCPVEGQELRWVNAAEARQLPFLEADVAVVRALETVYFSANQG